MMFLFSIHQWRNFHVDSFFSVLPDAIASVQLTDTPCAESMMGASLTDKCEMKKLVSERRQRTEKGSLISNVFQLVILLNEVSIAIGGDFNFQKFQEFIRTCHEHFPPSCLRCEKQLWNSDVLIIYPNTRVYRREASSFKPLDQMFNCFLLLPFVSLP